MVNEHPAERARTSRELATAIRFALHELRSRNGHHEFEHMCRCLARETVAPNLLPATGPVSQAGDQGRDFESFRTYIEQGGARIAFACTLQVSNLERKIRTDVEHIVGSDPPIGHVVYYCETDLPVGRRHRLQAEVAERFAVHLEVFDGQAIAELLAQPTLSWIAREFLHVRDLPVTRAASGGTPSEQLRAVAACSPQSLGVHGAIRDTRDAVTGVEFIVPRYVVRPHDHELRDFLHRAARGTRAEFVVLRGTSCVGKTRTAYEAVTDCLSSWRLVHLKSASSVPTAIEDLSGLRNVVIWLDDLHALLRMPGGEDAALAIRRHLERPGPTVTIATMWTADFQTVVTGSSQQAALLRAATTVHVPDTFAATEMELVRDAREDPSLDLAWRGARESRAICQTLAAAPDLLDRWVNSPNPYARALISAAVDSSNLGINGAIPMTVLSDAVVGYLTPAEHASADDDWARSAWAYATEPVKGVTAPLVPVPHPSAIDRVTGAVALCDYLEEHGRRLRYDAIPPPSLWEALARHIDDGRELCQLAREAERRRYRRLAAALQERAAAAGNARAMYEIGYALWGRRQRSEAEEWFRRSAERGDVMGLQSHADSSIPSSEAIRLWSIAAERGETFAIGRLARLLEDDGRPDDAEAWWRRGLELRDSHCSHELARRLARRGEHDESQQIWMELTAAGDSVALWELLTLLHSRGDHTEVRRWWELGIEAGCGLYARREPGSDIRELPDLPTWDWLYDIAHRGSARAMREIAGALTPPQWDDDDDDDDEAPVPTVPEHYIQEATRWVRAAAALGDAEAGKALRFAHRERQELEAAASNGDAEAMALLAERIEPTEPSRAEQLWRQAALGGNEWAVSRIAAMVRRQGGTVYDDVVICRLAESGNVAAMSVLGRALVAAGLLTRAERVLRRAAAGGGDLETMDLIECLVQVRQWADAEELSRLLLERTSCWEGVEERAEDALCEILRRTGRGEEAKRLRSYGLEPGGATALPFDLPSADAETCMDAATRTASHAPGAIPADRGTS